MTPISTLLAGGDYHEYPSRVPDSRRLTATLTAGSAAFPTASNTGIPPGTLLTPLAGGRYDGQDLTFTNRDITGVMFLTAAGKPSGVTINFVRCRFTANQLTDPSLVHRDQQYGRVQVNFTQCEGNGANLADSLIDQGGNWTADLLKTQRFNHPYVTSGDDIALTNFYIDDINPIPGVDTHTDGIYMGRGRRVLIQNGTILNAHNQTACVYVAAELGDIDDLLIDHLLVAGGGHCIYVWNRNGYVCTNTRVTNVHFSRLYSPTGGLQGGPWSVDADGGSPLPVITRTGNVWDDTGLPVNS